MGCKIVNKEKHKSPSKNSTFLHISKNRGSIPVFSRALVSKKSAPIDSAYCFPGEKKKSQYKQDTIQTHTDFFCSPVRSLITRCFAKSTLFPTTTTIRFDSTFDFNSKNFGEDEKKSHYEINPHTFCPSFHFIKGLQVRHVINQQGCQCTPMIHRRQRPKPLLTSCVPKLKFDLGTIQNAVKHKFS
jgi:hypothetical protein